MISILGILIAFGLLTVGVWKRLNLIIIAMISAAIIAISSGESIIAIWTGPFIEGFSSFAAPFLMLFVLGALFGKLMDDSGATWRIGTTIVSKVGEKWALVAYILVAAVLLYGGVSIFVIVFVLIPIARSIFEKGRVAWYLFPLITAYALVPTLSMFPGCLQLHNIIPTKYLGTALTAGAVEGIIASIVYVVLGGFYVYWEVKKGRENSVSPEIKESVLAEDDTDLGLDESAPNFISSIIPLVVALAAINVVKIDIIYGLVLACTVCLVLFKKSYKDLLSTINQGATNGIMPLVYVAIVVGIAKTVVITPAFPLFKDWLMALPISGLLKIFVVTNSMAAITGSSSGSMTMILEIFGQDFLAMGYSPGIIHRLLTVSSVALDTLPWNSFVVLLFSLSGVTYAKGYKQMFVISVVLPLIAALSIVVYGSLIF